MRFAPLLCLAVSATAAQASVLFDDDFNSYATGNLAGQGNWTVKSPGTATPQIVDGVLSSNPGTEDIIAPVTPAISFDAAQNPAANGFSFYLAADINVSTARNGDYFLHTAGSLTSSSFQSRIYLKSQGSGFVLGTAVTSNTPTYGTTELALNTDYRVIARYDVNEGASNDDVSLFVFPLGTLPVIEPAVAYAANVQSGSGDASGLGAVNFRQNGANNSPVLTLDNLLISTTFAEAAVPEPSSLAVIAMATGLLGRRRVRQ